MLKKNFPKPTTAEKNRRKAHMVKACPPPVQAGISREVVCRGRNDALK